MSSPEPNMSKSRRRSNNLTNRNSTAGSRDASADFRSSGNRGGKRKPNYRDAASDHNSSSERENRRPMRAAAKKNKFVNPGNSDESSDMDDEEGILHKTTVTSRGRVSKPNPRVVWWWCLLIFIRTNLTATNRPLNIIQSWLYLLQFYCSCVFCLFILFTRLIEKQW